MTPPTIPQRGAVYARIFSEAHTAAMNAGFHRSAPEFAEAAVLRFDAVWKRIKAKEAEETTKKKGG